MTVVVAEDEMLVRMLAADTLADAGFIVIEAVDAADAIAALQAHEGAVVLLFTDVHMPGEMTGLELADLVRARWPAIAILITSGLNRPHSCDLPFLSKPYRPESVMAQVHALIG